MKPLKRIERSARICFSPRAPLLAAGSASNAVDVSFSSSSTLEIFPVDLAAVSQSCLPCATISAPDSFSRIVWGSSPSTDATLKYGMIAGGLGDGSIMLWDPAVALEKHGPNAVLAKMQHHQGGVKGLDFNLMTSPLLASGGTDGSTCIWDLEKPREPAVHPALQGVQAAQSGPEITYISWNRKVPHILASTCSNGSTVVWDMKRQRPVITLRDSGSRKCSALQWSPVDATQLVIGFEDDRSPTLQLWDLKNSMSPLKEFVGHSKGVLSMAWCPQDPSLLLSSGKDNRIICWDVDAADIVSEFTSANSSFDTQWCPTIPGVIASASFEGQVSIQSWYDSRAPRAGAQAAGALPEGVSKPVRKAPAWMLRPCSAAFGFGGKLVSFFNQRQQISDAGGHVRTHNTASLTISQLITERELVQKSRLFEDAIAGNDRSSLKAFCAHKETESIGSDGETWAFLRVILEEDARKQLLRQLGLGDALAPTREPSTANSLINAASDLVTQAEHLLLSPKEDVDMSPANQEARLRFLIQSLHYLLNSIGKAKVETLLSGEDFFDNLPEQVEVAPSPQALEHVGQMNGNTFLTGDEYPVETASELEEDVQRALFVGNYDAAVELCFKANRMADALLIANVGGADLNKRTMHRYMQHCPHPYMQVVSALVDDDYMQLVKTRPVAQWKETMAVLATYSQTEKWSLLCDALAQRLAHAGMHHAASLCYICAGSVDQVVLYWSQSVSAGAVPVHTLQEIIEKSIIMGMAANHKKTSASLSQLVTNYASLLAAQGCMATAMEYLDLIAGEASESVAVMKERIYYSGAPDIQASANPPTLPFAVEDVPAQVESLQQPPFGGAADSYGQPGYASHAYGGAASTAADASYYHSSSSPQAAYQQPYMASQPSAGSTDYGGAYAPAGMQVPGAAGSQYGYAAAPPPVGQPGFGASAYGSGYEPGMAAAYPGSGAAPMDMNPVYKVSRPKAPTYGSVSTQPQSPAFPPTPATAAPTAAGSAAQPPPPPPQAAFFQPAPGPVARQPSGGGAGGAAAAPGPPGMAPPPPGAPPRGVAPPEPKPVAPPAPAGPPANITLHTADTSKVPPEHKPILNSLTRLFNTCAPLAQNPVKRKEMDDNAKRLGVLFWKLNSGKVPAPVAQKLAALCQALDAGNPGAASQVQLDLTTSHWEECGHWLTALKRLIKALQGL